MITFRKYTDKDWQMVAMWHREWCQEPTPWTFYPPTTYMAEVNGFPVACACLYLMNNAEAAMIENLVGHPTKHDERNEAVPKLFAFLEDQASAWGYKRMIVLAFEDKLKMRYTSFGYSKTKDNITSFMKLLRGGN